MSVSSKGRCRCFLFMSGFDKILCFCLFVLFVGETIYTPVIKRYLVSGNKSKHTSFQLAGNPLQEVKMGATSGVIVREFIHTFPSISGSVEKIILGACSVDDAMFGDVVAAVQQHNVLRELKIDHSSISSLDKLKSLGASITALDFSFNRLNSISRNDFQSVVNLKSLKLSGNKLQDSSGLEHLIHLTDLWLDQNQISNITSLKKLRNLTIVRLYANRITNLDVFADKTKLRYLDLTQNEITDISPLGNLIDLQQLDIDNNKVSNISALYNLQLSAVLLGGNDPVINKTEIVRLQEKLGPAFGCAFYNDESLCSVRAPRHCRNCIFCAGTDVLCKDM